MAHRNRDKLPHWSKDQWDCLDAAIRRECHRARVVAKSVTTVYGPQDATTVATDVVTEPPPNPALIPRWQAPRAPAAVINADTVDEGAYSRVLEHAIGVEFTQAQVEQEANRDHRHHADEHDHAAHEHGHQAHDHHRKCHSTGVTLVGRAAQMLAACEDMAILRGYGAWSDPLFSNVRWLPNGLSSDFGLINVIPSIPPNFPVQPWPAGRIITVNQAQPGQGQPAYPPYTYQEHTFTAVAQGYELLMGSGFSGPITAIVHPVVSGSAHTPLPTTLITPADAIESMLKPGELLASAAVDAPGYQAALLGAAAAANPPQGVNPPVAAANAAGAYAVNYGATLGVAAATAAAAATANGENNQANAQADGQTAAFNSAAAIQNYPNPPANAQAIQVAPAGLPNFYGCLVSASPDVVDIVRTVDATLRFEEIRPNGVYAFSVFQRFAYRIKTLDGLIPIAWI